MYMLHVHNEVTFYLVTVAIYPVTAAFFPRRWAITNQITNQITARLLDVDKPSRSDC